jgi:hypothetical protein
MALRLNGSNTGYVELDVPADAGSHTLILPDGGGTAHQVLKNSATAGTLEYGVTLPSGNGSAHQVLKNSATAGTLEYGLALPSGNGTSGQYLQTDGLGGSSWVTPAAGGKILQVVSTTKTDKTSTISTSPTAVSGLSASITPASTSSKILVTASFQTSIGTSGYGGFYYLYYNDGATTSVIQDYTGDAAGSRKRVASQIESSSSQKANTIVFEFLHSPAKDTSISYQVYFAAESSSYDVVIGGTYTDPDSAAFARMASTITLMEVAA